MTDDPHPHEADAASDQADQEPGEISLGYSAGDLVLDPERIGLRPITEDLLREYDHSEAQSRYEPSLEGTPTGLSDLDAVTGGLKAGSLYLLAAQPGSGRTSLALGIAFYAAVAQGRTVVIFSPRMKRSEVTQRILSAQANVSREKLIQGRLTEEEWTQVALVIEAAFQSPFFVDSQPELTAEYVLTESRAMDGLGAGLVVVNSLEQMTGHTSRPTRDEEMVDIVRDLKRAARELDAPVLVTCGVSRDALKRMSRRPLLGDLSGRGGLEEIADSVFLLYLPPDDYHSSPETDSPTVTVNPAELIVALNRGGVTGMVQLGFVAAFRKFIGWVEMTDNPTGF